MAARSPSGHDRRLHGQRAGRPLSPALKSQLGHLADFALTDTAPPVHLHDQALDLADHFPAARGLWLEIGFGSGEHMIHHGRANPDIGLIGSEVYMRGVASTIGKLRATRLANIRIHPGDIRDLLDVLPSQSITRTFLMFPDPWPKRRHHKRRFVTPQYLDPLARVMAPGAELRIATDIADYVRQTLTMIQIQGAFRWTACRPQDWIERWPDSIPTRYEEKALGQERRCFYLTFARTG